MIEIRRIDSDNASHQRNAAVWEDARIRLIFSMLGFTPIAALALSITEILPLHVGAPILLGAAVSIGIGLASAHTAYVRQVGFGLLSGLVAVLKYDCTRLPFVLLGDWPDFIPEIGNWLFNNSGTHWSVGYLWRYLGNGAGMGMAFSITVPITRRWIDPRLSGLVFGLIVWTGLLTTLFVAPAGQEKLFFVTPATLLLSLTGHIVFGAILGAIAHQQGIRQTHCS